MKIDQLSIGVLDDATTGEVITSQSKDYNEARKIWNGMFDKKPAIISRCSSVQDVVESIKFAKKNNLLLAVKGGGHNSAYHFQDCEGPGRLFAWRC
jgi:FAD/FMN-containing dehydrogenase